MNRNHLIIILCASIFVKFAILIGTTVVTDYFNVFDLTVYYKYLELWITGQVPYVDFTVEYPQLFFLAVIPPYLIACLLGNTVLYYWIHPFFMILVDAACALCVYHIGMYIFNNNEGRAFISAFLYTVAISSSYWVLNKYDGVPVLFMLIAIILFFKEKERCSAWTWTALGFLSKWFPAVQLPFFAIYEYKNTRNLKKIAYGAFIFSIVVAIITIPFFISSPDGFLFAYKMHGERAALAHSFIYYIDFILAHFSNVSIASISIIIVGLLELVLLYQYFREPENKPITLVNYIGLALMIFVIFNKVFSPQYIVWVTPFMALFFADSTKGIATFFIAQILNFTEYPILMFQIYELGHYGSTKFDISTESPYLAFAFFTLKWVLWIGMFFMMRKYIQSEKADLNNI